MDDDILHSSIFDSELSFQDYLKQFTLSQPQVPHEGARVKCELAEYDSVYNSEGKEVVLRSGTAPSAGRPRCAENIR